MVLVGPVISMLKMFSLLPTFASLSGASAALFATFNPSVGARKHGKYYYFYAADVNSKVIAAH